MSADKALLGLWRVLGVAFGLWMPIGIDVAPAGLA